MLDFIGPLHCYTVATDRIVGLSPIVEQGLYLYALCGCCQDRAQRGGPKSHYISVQRLQYFLSTDYSGVNVSSLLLFCQFFIIGKGVKGE